MEMSFTFKHCRLVIDHDRRYCETIFEDGAKAPACPSEVQKEFAKGMGYDDVWEMVWHHEFLHTWVCEFMGLEHSQVLWNVAHDVENLEVHHYEEGRVLIVQKLLKAGMIPDLLKILQCVSG